MSTKRSDVATDETQLKQPATGNGSSTEEEMAPGLNEQLVAIKERGKRAASDHENQKQLQDIVQGNLHDKLKREAINGIANPGILRQLRDESPNFTEAINYQIARLLAGRHESELTEAQCLAEVEQLAAEDKFSVALLTKNKEIGALALSELKRIEQLTDLCLFATAVHVRKAAAARVVEAHDHQLNVELLQKLSGKDKTLTKIFAAAVEQQEPTAAATIGTDKPAVDSEQPQVAEELAEPQSVKAQGLANSAPLKNGKAATKTGKKPGKKQAKLATPALTELLSAIKKLSPKNSSAIEIHRQHLQAHTDAALEAQQDILSECQTLLTSLLEANREFQKETSTRVEGLYRELADLLEQGQSQSALKLWDKILGGINNTSGKVQARLQSMGGVYKAKLKELQDWKNFADTEKKKELITRIESLVGSTENPGSIAKKIRALHEEWKQLGRTSQNESLWRKFKTLSDQAYAPCKEYFKLRKKQMAENLTKRKELCANLEKELAEIDSENLNTSKIGTLISTAEESWKSHAPVEQGKIKPIQKRYYESINKLRNLRKEVGRKNAMEKQTLVKQAAALTDLDDHRQAMETAKALQQKWKLIGPSSFREDKKLWSDFRAACDAVFEKRNQIKDKLQAELHELEGLLSETLTALEVMVKLDEEELRSQRAQYHDLQQQFSANLDPRLKLKRGKLLDRFNAIKRTVDARYKQLPDKKEIRERASVSARVTFCENLEASLQQHDYKLEQPEDRLQDWKNMEAVTDSSLAKLLESRFNSINSVKSATEYQQLQQEAALKIKEACVEAEILAGVETPEADQNIRMQFQLMQLKKGFGQSKPNAAEKLKTLKALGLKVHCLGPKSEEAAADAEERLRLAINRVA